MRIITLIISLFCFSASTSASEIREILDLYKTWVAAVEEGDIEWQKEIKEKKNRLRNISDYVFPEFEDPTDILNHFPDFII